MSKGQVKFCVRYVTDRPALMKYLIDLKPRGCSIHADGSHEVWLLKPTERGGRTIGRVLIVTQDKAVHDMVDAAWRGATNSYA